MKRFRSKIAVTRTSKLLQTLLFWLLARLFDDCLLNMHKYVRLAAGGEIIEVFDHQIIDKSEKFNLDGRLLMAAICDLLDFLFTWDYLLDGSQVAFKCGISMFVVTSHFFVLKGEWSRPVNHFQLRSR